MRDSKDQSAAGQAFELPLMPLNNVLFPFMPAVILAEEHRYRRLAEDCLRGSRVFGVVLIASGREVGGEAVPHSVGTEAIVARAEKLPSGAYKLIVIGRHRFRVLELLPPRPYPVAKVSYAGMQERIGAISGAELDSIRAHFAKHLDVIVALMGQPGRTMDIPEDPLRLSYMISAHLTAPYEVKQMLLEADTAADRLAMAAEIMRREAREFRLIYEAGQLASGAGDGR